MKEAQDLDAQLSAVTEFRKVVTSYGLVFFDEHKEKIPVGEVFDQEADVYFVVEVGNLKSSLIESKGPQVVTYLMGE